MTKRGQVKAGIRGIEQPVAIRILKTMGRYVLTGDDAPRTIASSSVRLTTTFRSSAFSTARMLTADGQMSPKTEHRGPRFSGGGKPKMNPTTSAASTGNAGDVMNWPPLHLVLDSRLIPFEPGFLDRGCELRSLRGALPSSQVSKSI